MSLAPEEVDATDPEGAGAGIVAGQSAGTPRDWAWRRKIRANPTLYPIYRVAVAVVGGAVSLLGLVLIPAPGPGWAVVFVGLAILASEFVWARRLLAFARRQVGRWTSWAGRQSLIVRGLLGLVTIALLLGLVWCYLRLAGVPGFVPDALVPGWLGLR